MASNPCQHLPTLILSGLYLLPTALTAVGQETTPQYQPQPFVIENVSDRIVPIDINGDGLKDLIAADATLLSIYLQKSGSNVAPFNFNKADISLQLPGRSAGWDVDWNTQSSSGKAVRIVALIDGKKILAWPIVDNILGAEQTLVENLSGDVPAGAYPLDFVRDINNDQRNDFIIPGTNHHSLLLQTAEGKYKGGIEIKSNLWVQSRLSDSENLTSDIGQQVTIPDIRIRDVNGDKIKDLISRANDILEVFLAKADGSYAVEPSYRYDFNEIEERLGEPRFEDIDFSNLSSVTRYSYNFFLDDINGDNIDDLLIREAGKVVFYLGTADGMNLQQPQQVLRSGGNVFAALLLDEDEDDHKDLWLMRVEDISLGKAFVWLALSGSITIEAYIYRNEGKQFARRPHKKKIVNITFPSLLKSLSIFSDIQNKAGDTRILRTTQANTRGADTASDLLILDQNGIRVHLDVLQDQLSREDMFLGLIDDVRAKDEFSVDLNKILANVGVQGQQHLDLIAGREPNFVLSLGKAAEELEAASDFMTLDLNNDQYDDIIVLTQRDESSIKGVLYLSKSL